jgi:protein-S-isoprenylcysteine O-methyltransferase Ste14
MLWRAVFAFFALPGIVAYAIPLALVSKQLPSLRLRPFGSIVLAMGTIILVWCVVEFYIRGRGTLAPWAPPRFLVVAGPYRFSRNPMYVAVALVLIGWAGLFWSLLLTVYAAIVLLAFHIRVVGGEEPWLARNFGADWEGYKSQVSRWLI